MDNPLGEDGQQQDCHDVCDFDHRVHRWTGSIFVGIANRVAGYRSMVGVGALAAMVSIFDIFFGVIPRAASGGHGQCHEKARDDSA